MDLAVVLGLTLAAAPVGAPVDEGIVSLPGEERRARIRQHLDWERSQRGLGPLRAVATLDAAAQTRAERLVDKPLEPLPGIVEELAESGYEAAEAQLVKLTGAGPPERVLSELLERNRTFRSILLESDLPDLGVGVGRGAGRPVDLLIFALSDADRFARRIEGLDDLGAVRERLLDWVNWARREFGRAAPLHPDPCLDRVAQAYAERMLRDGFFDHRSPDGGDLLGRVRAAGCRVWSPAENLAGGPHDPEDVIASWLESTGHRQVLLSRRHDRVGFGLAYGRGANGWQVLWVQVLGSGAPV